MSANTNLDTIIAQAIAAAMPTMVEAVTSAVVAQLDTAAPAKPAKKGARATRDQAIANRKAREAQAQNDFHAWIVETAPARAQRKADNKAHSAWLDANRAGWRGAANKDAIWGARKAGKRVPAVK